MESATQSRTRMDSERTPHGLLLARLGYESTARFRRSLRPLGLTAQQFMVLKQVDTLDSSSQGEIADALGIDYSNLATIAAALCDRGLVERTRDQTDRRRYVLDLSPEGRRMLAHAEAAISDGEEEMIAGLDPEEREQFRSLLRRVADQVSLCPTSREPTTCASVEAAAVADADAEAQGARRAV